jgi:hypothetical protein
VSWLFGFLLNELPFIAFFWLAATTLLAAVQGDLASPIGLTAFGLAILTTGGLAVIVWRARQTRPAVEQALATALGAGWRSGIDAGMVGRLRRRLPLSRILFGPFFVRRRDVRRVANIPYGDAGKRNQLDVYHHRGRPSGGPVLVYLHGGGFPSGRKNREARPLLYRLASQGWVCISANYRLVPAARFPEHLVDVKKAIAWAREHGHEYGADTAWVLLPDFVARALARHRKAQTERLFSRGLRSELVVSNTIGEPFHPPTFSRMWRDWAKTHGFAGIRLHGLRHGAATLLLAAGVPDTVAMRTMGHADTRILARYQDVVSELQRDAAVRMDQLLGG